MLALSDESMSTLCRLAEPLAPQDRFQFLRDVAAQLGQHEVLGEGLISRVAETQKRYLRPPDLSMSRDCSKWR